MTNAKTILDRLRGINELNRIGTTDFSSSVTGASGAAKTLSCEDALCSLLSSASKQAEQFPPALTGVVHLLYFVPQVLQIATVKQA
jgi:hypothetical protein